MTTLAVLPFARSHAWVKMMTLAWRLCGFVTLGDFSRLLLPEHERAVVEDVTLRQRHDAVLGPELFEALVHDLLAGVTVWPPLLTTKEDAIDFPTRSARDVPRSEGPLIQDEGTRQALRLRLGRAVLSPELPGRAPR